MRIGTRKSTMAIAQTNEVIRLITEAYPEISVDIHHRDTAGDTDQTSRLDVHGGKGGAFVDAIRSGLLNGDIQMAMHTLKGMPGNEDNPEVVIGACLRRDYSEDALVLRDGIDFQYRIGDFPDAETILDSQCRNHLVSVTMPHRG